MAIARMIFIVLELTIPVLLGAKYGIGAGVMAVLLMMAVCSEIALKEIIDAEKENKS